MWIRRLRTAVVRVAIAAVVGAGTWAFAGHSFAEGDRQLVALAWRHADNRAYAVDNNGALYSSAGFCGPFLQCAQLPAGNVPTGLLDGDVGGSLDVGSIFTITGTFPAIGLSLCTNVFDAAVPTKAETWGRVKARLR